MGVSALLSTKFTEVSLFFFETDSDLVLSEEFIAGLP